MARGKRKSDSEKCIIKVDLDGNWTSIKTQDGKIYIYDNDEVNNDVIDRLIEGGAKYTVYEQGEKTTWGDMELRERDNAPVSIYSHRFRWF